MLCNTSIYILVGKGREGGGSQLKSQFKLCIKVSLVKLLLLLLLLFSLLLLLFQKALLKN